MTDSQEQSKHESASGADAAPLALLPWEGRAILLVDLDAFFASVEQLDHPAWRGKPVIVGGSPDRRGVVSTASYEARAYGVHSAMPSSTARKLCPQAIWTEGHFSRYREVSNQVMEILLAESPHVQQVSIDEAFVDVSPTRTNRDHPVAVAQRIRTRVSQLGITCSVGVGTTKAIAKLASDMDKPDGLTVVYPGSETGFLAPLPVRKLSGIGASAEAKLNACGIETLGDLAAADDALVTQLLGKNGATMQLRARGLEDGDVEPDDEVKSVSNEMSFAVSLTEREDIEAAISTMGAKVGRRLRRKGLAGRVLTLKVRYEDRKVRTVQRQMKSNTDDELVFVPLAIGMLDEVWQPGMSLRLVGIAISGFDEPVAVQESLFDDSVFGPDASGEAPVIADEDKRRGLLDATDRVRARFGDNAVRYGKEMRMGENTTGSSAKNPEDYK